MSVRVLTGDCRDIMRAMGAESVDCIVTSPPYWGLRDYGIAGQLGLEASLGEHIATMVDVFEAAKRVLKKTGTVWLNLGDVYAASVNGRAAADTKAIGNDDRTFRDKPFSTVGGVFKPKDLCMVPARLAIALQEAGWWVRSEIIWHKPNPMPELTRDRPTSAHEKIYLLAKSERYFYDAEATAEAGEELSAARYRTAFGMGPKGVAGIGSPGNQHKFNNGMREFNGMRNKRNVWTVPSSPFSDAHFATFPPALIEPCILAGCPSKVCAKCGKPWVRKVIAESRQNAPSLQGKYNGDGIHRTISGGVANDSRSVIVGGFVPSCHCKTSFVSGTVLDPFGGAGTTGLVADRLGRNAILIELNPAYAAMAMNRVADDLPLFAEVTAQ